MINFNALNREQRDAVRCVKGPVVVVAGAGTGKTRTIAYRTAHMLEVGIEPGAILAITFTNKAAREMRERISAMVGFDTCTDITISTIHSLCARILRDDIDKVGRDTSFTIFDTSDQVGIIRKALAKHGFDPRKNEPRALQFGISTLKNIYPPVDVDDIADPVMSRVFPTYNKMLEDNNALDFDDLLLFAIRVLDIPECRDRYRERFRYVMVDEFQDINDIQYGIVRRLVGKRSNIYVVGDDDQSIYGWRGAVVDNFLNFEEDFAGAREVKLERNYRSTGVILEASGAVIENNEKRRRKKLWTSGKAGDPIGMIEALDEQDEATLVIDCIVGDKQRLNMKYGDFAILYRTNAQSRVFEEKLVRMGISYILIGGTRFFERKEIKDMTAFLRVMHNPEDETALLRVINYPPRGIGATSLDRIRDAALEARRPLFHCLEYAVHSDNIPKKARKGVARFLEVIEAARQKLKAGGLATAGKFIVDELDIENAVRKSYSDRNEADRRFMNVEEWINSLIEYESNEPKPTIEGYLENVALMTDEQEVDTELKEDSITMMTVHSAKGLEFHTVFIVGAEEKLLPHEKSIQDGSIDEERRLFYVAMTRARRKLYISYAAERRRYGETQPRITSRFVGEIPEELFSYQSVKDIEERRLESGKKLASTSLKRIAMMLED